MFSCKNNPPEVKKVSVKEPQKVEEEISDLLQETLTIDSIITIDSVELITYRYFKKHYNNQLLWFAKNKLTKKGEDLLHIIERSEYDGLIPSQYHLNEINKNKYLITSQKDFINVSAIVNADLLLSDAYYLLGAHLNKGRFYKDSLALQTNFNKLDKGWDSLLFKGYETATLHTTLDSLEPKFYSYRELKKQLAIIINDKKMYSFDSIPFVHEKDSLIKQHLIVKNLITQGFYDTTSTSTDSVILYNAYNKLQKKWFIQPDGKLGKYTQQALGYNRTKIIRQISMAMERWRWESAFPEKYAWVNIPAFELTVFGKDTVVMQSAVVCGKPENQTPILKSKIDHMLIYPYWNVPYSIAWKEILPAVKRDTTYIRKKNFEVIGANNVVLDYTKLPWRKYSKEYLPVTFRQRIGTENSLGVVKFNFYNPYGVYLHDTNSKRYFKTSSRAQSHGCIRLEKFTEFANFLIRDDSLHYTPDSLLLYFSKQEQRKLSLKKALPIYLRYYTANADSTGLQLYLDVYRKDEAMINLIYSKKSNKVK